MKIGYFNCSFSPGARGQKKSTVKSRFVGGVCPRDMTSHIAHTCLKRRSGSSKNNLIMRWESDEEFTGARLLDGAAPPSIGQFSTVYQCPFVYVATAKKPWIVFGGVERIFGSRFVVRLKEPIYRTGFDH